MEQNHTNINDSFATENLIEQEQSFSVSQDEQQPIPLEIDNTPLSPDQNPFIIYNHEGKIKLRLNHATKLNMIKSIIAILFIAGVYIYFTLIMSHQCPEIYPSEDDCMQYLSDQISPWLQVIFVLSLILNSIYQLSKFKYISPLFKYMIIFMVLYITLIQYEINPSNMDVREYSAAHCLFLIALLMIVYTGMQLIAGCICLYKKYKIIFYSIQLLILIFLYKFGKAAQISCEGWELGIKGQIDFEHEYCQIQQPTLCWPVVLDNFFKLGPETCDLSEEKKEEIKLLALQRFGYLHLDDSENKQSKLLNTTHYIAWPDLVNFSPNDRHYDVVQEKFIKNSEIVNSVDEGYKKGAEVVVDLDEPGLHIKVKNDVEKVKERKKYFKKKQKEYKKSGKKQIESMSQNVIIIYIDTLSRAHTYRKLPKTIEYFRNKVEQQLENQQHVYEFFRFHSMDKKTINSVLKMNYDYKFDDVYREIRNNKFKYSATNKIKNLVNEFKEAGYMTAHIVNTCTSQCLFRSKFADVDKYFNQTAADHEFSIWDPMYINPANYYDLSYGPSSLQRRCLYGNDTAAYMLEYGEQFLNTYPNEKKFIYFEFTDAHELTSEVIQYLDDSLPNFLNNIDGITKQNSIVYFMSDHGQHLIQPFFTLEAYVNPKTQYDTFLQTSMPRTNVYHIERVLPLLFFMVSDDIIQKYGDELKHNLERNEQIIQSMGHLRNTFMQNAYGLDFDQKYENSMFMYRNSSESCIDIDQVEYLPPEIYCGCRPYNWRDI